MKKFNFKGVLDNFRTSVAQPVRVDQDIQETLRPEHFQVKRTFRHGFPFQPTAMAFDPVQKLLAIGSKCGSLRIFGQPGVDMHVRHDMDGPPGSSAVLQLQFLVNDGALVSATADDTLHLWNFRQKLPQVVQSLKFQKEKITCMQLPMGSKWLYVGTERGNIHVVHIENFHLSGYIINWNKAIELSRKTHPGSVVHLSDNPLDSSKLLIGFECGQVVIWDLRSKVADMRFQTAEALRSISWHFEGKQFMCSHIDGSLTTWSVRTPMKPIHISQPHAKVNKDGKLEQCKQITKVEWKTSKSGEAYVIFSGGMPYDQANRTPSITIVHSKTTTVLEMEHPVLDFITLCESPYVSDLQEPYAIITLLQNDLVVLDLQAPGYPCLENPYPMDLHESPVTCCAYLADCPADLIPAFYSVGRSVGAAAGGGNASGAAEKRANMGFSEREWPISGGTWSAASCSYSEIILTGHADGSIKFWDASAGTLQVLYKLKTAKVFERPARRRSLDNTNSTNTGTGTSSGGGGGDPSEEPFAVQLVALCAESRKLCVAGASSHVVLFTYRKTESCDDVTVLEVPIVYENPEEGEVSPDCQFSGPGSAGSGNRLDMYDTDNKKDMLKVRTGLQKKPAGFQAQLVCLTPWNHGNPPSHITSLTINSSYGLMAYGNAAGIVIIDIEQKVCLLNIGSPDLYGAQDPYARAPRSPKRGTHGNNGGGGGGSGLDCLQAGQDDRHHNARSPSIDQFGRSPPDVTSHSSPCPASSPIEPATEAIEEILHDDTSTKIITIPAQRRKSSTWKSFNFKRQFSKVDMKLKKTAETTSSSSSTTKKRNSIFYAGISPENNETKSSPEDEENDDNEENETSEEATVIESSAGGGLESIYSADTSPELEEDLLIVGSLGSQFELPKKSVGFKTCERPTELNLSKITLTETTDGMMAPPVRPPRVQTAAQLARKRGEKHRLCSVPNIKLPKAELQHLRDLRNRQQEAATLAASGGGGGGGGVVGTGQSPGGGGGGGTAGQGQPSFAGSFIRRFNKLDSSFSRSRSSSMSSLETITAESIQCLAFADSYARRNDNTIIPTLWVGTSLGSVLTILITPPDLDSRSSQPVVVSLVGVTIFRLKGAIMSMSFLDCNGALIPYSFESWKDDNKERQRTPTKSTNRMSPTLGENSSRGDSCTDRQYVVIASEKQARVVALPSQTCIYRQQIADVDFVVKAESITFKDSVCLMCYVSNGHLVAYSLPSLKPLIDIDFLPLSELSFQTQSNKGIVDPMLSIWGQQFIINEDTDQISRTFCFSNKGHGLYLSSPSELQKYTLCTDFCSNLSEMVGELFLPLEMPEPPKESFFKGLFGGGVRTLDREELFGEASGKANKTVAKHIPGAQMTELGTRVMSSTSEVNRAHKLMVERGEKLNQLEDKAERMRNEAENFSGNAHELMLKYRDKKWYQL